MNIITNIQVASIILFGSLAESSPWLIASTSTPAQCIANNPIPVIKAISEPQAARDSRSRRPRQRDLTDVSIGGIKIGMTLQQVTNKLGKPNKISQISDPCTGQKRITLGYYKLVITVLGEGVLQIDNSNPLYQTGEKIKIGDPLRKAQKTYDKILVTPSSYSEDGRELLYDKSADGSLRFKSKSGRITSMSIIVDDC